MCYALLLSWVLAVINQSYQFGQSDRTGFIQSRPVTVSQSVSCWVCQMPCLLSKTNNTSNWWRVSTHRENGALHISCMYLTHPVSRPYSQLFNVIYGLGTRLYVLTGVVPRWDRASLNETLQHCYTETGQHLIHSLPTRCTHFKHMLLPDVIMFSKRQQCLSGHLSSCGRKVTFRGSQSIYDVGAFFIVLCLEVPAVESCEGVIIV